MEPILWYILVVNGLVLVGQVTISIIFFYFSHQTSKTIKQAIADVNKQLEDKKMLNEITKKLDAKFGNRMSKFSKKVQMLQKEAGIDDGGFLGMLMDAADNEEGIIDYAIRNKGKVLHVAKGLTNKNAEEVEEDLDEMERPDWATEDDEKAIADFVEARRLAHGKAE